MNRKKKIGILGSTGSIGKQTLEVIDLNEDLEVVALSANTSVDKVYEQCVKYKPELVAMMDAKSAGELKKRLKVTSKDLDNIVVCEGIEGLIRVAIYKNVEILVTAVVGMIGLRPTVEAIKAHKTIALANKETLVTAGEIIMPLAAKEKVSIIPVDSEHSAIYQSMVGNKKTSVEKLILTASGGPFRGYTHKELEQVTKAQALKHPNWSMGAKITIDSATMMNKGLEVIEAKWLFDVSVKDIQVVVHPESILHSAVQYLDGSVIAQMGMPDMRLPIQYALYEGERRFMPYKRLDLTSIGKLHFETPDLEVFTCLKLAFQAIELGNVYPTVMNEANEEAVRLFLDEKIRFVDIPKVITDCMSTYRTTHDVLNQLTLESILSTKEWVDGYIERRWRE